MAHLSTLFILFMLSSWTYAFNINHILAMTYDVVMSSNLGDLQTIFMLEANKFHKLIRLIPEISTFSF